MTTMFMHRIQPRAQRMPKARRARDVAAVGAVLALGLLAGCAATMPNSATGEAKVSAASSPKGGALRASALEAHGPLQLPFASAHRWLYFPMYQRDTAHAVDLSALRWRADTLLQSASRYPMHNAEGWPAEVYAKAWYITESRLIDCQTGANASLSEALLTKDGQVLFERGLPATVRRRDASRDDRSEIAMACLAAADPDLLSNRRLQAKAAQPALSALPLVTQLGDDTWVLLEKSQFEWVDAARSAKTATAEALPALIRQQHAQWQRELSGPALKDSAQLTDWPVEPDLALRVARELSGEDEPKHFSILPQGQWTLWVASPNHCDCDENENEDLRNAERMALRLNDCLTGAALPMRYRWVDREGATLRERPLSVNEALDGAQLLERSGRNEQFGQVCEQVLNQARLARLERTAQSQGQSADDARANAQQALQEAAQARAEAEDAALQAQTEATLAAGRATADNDAGASGKLPTPDEVQARARELLALRR